MQYLIVSLIALIGSGLTLFSGFGLGTLLLPVFALFLPVELAIVLTAVVHFLNNLFKLVLVGRHTHWPTVLRFGIPSIIAAFAGAYLLTAMSRMWPLAHYQLGDHTFFIRPVQLVVGLLLVLFALFELVPALASKQFDPKYQSLGGLLSGFFGGLSGHQGALRSAFLIRSGLNKQQYIATGVVIACLVDVSRLSIYAEKIVAQRHNLDYLFLGCATLSAFAGAYIGNKLLGKITVTALQYIVGTALMLFGVALAAGLVDAGK